MDDVCIVENAQVIAVIDDVCNDDMTAIVFVEIVDAVVVETFKLRTLIYAASIELVVIYCTANVLVEIVDPVAVEKVRN